MKVVLVGIQGAGKSTQGNLLSQELQVPYLSSGHIFREMSKSKSKLGRYVKETINAGILIPDDMTIKVIEEYLSRKEYKNGYILDGFPRTVPQAESFADGAEAVVFLRVSDKEALWRISGRQSDREDETLQAIRKRIQLFHELTAPVLDYYRDRGKLIEVDGELEVDDVFAQVKEKLRQ